MTTDQSDKGVRSFSYVQDQISKVIRVLAIYGVVGTASYLHYGNGLDMGEIVFIMAVALTGAALYHFMTSFARCFACERFIWNFDIGRGSERGKLFTCPDCLTITKRTEGFYWKRSTPET